MFAREHSALVTHRPTGRYIGDFTDEDRYDASFKRLLRDPREGEG